MAQQLRGQNRFLPSQGNYSSTRVAKGYRLPTVPHHGPEDIAELCARFITYLFACPALQTSPPLAEFIDYALQRTCLHPCVTFAALYLLHRLKSRFPAASGASSHRLFITAFMLASKLFCDDTYSNRSWVIVGQYMFALREVNQMEREMCSHLDWQLNINPDALVAFAMAVARDFHSSKEHLPLMVPCDTLPRTSASDPTTRESSTSKTTSHTGHSFSILQTRSRASSRLRPIIPS